MRLLPNRIAVTIHQPTTVTLAQIGSRISLIDASGSHNGPACQSPDQIFLHRNSWDHGHRTAFRRARQP